MMAQIGYKLEQAMAKETREYINASPEDFSEELQALTTTESQIYAQLKKAREAVLVQLRSEFPVTQGRAVVGAGYTRWGQWQVFVDDKPQPKAQANGTRRESIADYRARMQAGGHAI